MRQEPYSLPEGFKWDTLLLDDPLVLKEVRPLLLHCCTSGQAAAQLLHSDALLYFCFLHFFTY